MSREPLVKEMARILTISQAGIPRRCREGLAERIVSLGFRWAKSAPENRSTVLAEGKREILAWYRTAAQQPSKGMNKAAVIGALAGKLNLSKGQVSKVLDSLATLAAKEARNGFVVPGLGKLVLRNRAARMGRNPLIGEPIKVPVKRVLSFRIAKSLRDAVLGKR